MKLITNLFNAISDNLISGGAYYLIAKAVLVTLFMTITAWIVAAALGILVSYLMCYEKKVVSNIGRGVCFVFRSVPALLTVWLFYYCLFGKISINGMITGGVAIGFWGAGHLAEVLSRAVKKEQLRVSKTISEKMESIYYTTVIPQALEDSLFDLKRLSVHILQWTAIAGYIGVNDLTEVMYGIGHRTMYPFFSIAFAAILYMIATLLIEGAFKLIEKVLIATGEKADEDEEEYDE
ncbi:MAG: ABC transporter permease subunit [Lachnospiraceae bacterium]|nr:ABC transporter permease subunit [Lachnospiraceae bacterium]